MEKSNLNWGMNDVNGTLFFLKLTNNRMEKTSCQENTLNIFQWETGKIRKTKGSDNWSLLKVK